MNDDLRTDNDQEYDARIAVEHMKKIQWTSLQLYGAALLFTVALMYVLRPETFGERCLALVISATVSLVLWAMAVGQQTPKKGTSHS